MSDGNSPNPFSKKRTLCLARFSEYDLGFFDDNREPLNFSSSSMILQGTLNPIVWILQMTISRDHGGSDRGYKRIKAIKEKGKGCCEEKVEAGR